MNHRSAQLTGLSIFSASGVIFLVGAIDAGDTTNAIGSAVWLVGCAVWALPFLRSNSND
jgi:drug/metabolite transporter (DMT)-like permease